MANEIRPRPKIWTPAEIIDDCAVAIEEFRKDRVGEPRSLYEAEMTNWQDQVALTVSQFHKFLDGSLSDEDLQKVVGTDDGISVLRYTAAPPISTDDLKTLSGSTLARTRLYRSEDELRSVRSILEATHDAYRFPWISENREASKDEIDCAVLATLSVLVTQRVQTLRRNDAKSQQESAVRAILSAAQYELDPSTSKFDGIDEGPAVGQYSGERKVSGTKADVIARLKTKDLLLVECKVSNSAVNSYKRLNHEAVNKATTWLKELGSSRAVPAAVLRGVFNPDNVLAAQNSGLAIFWEHRLTDLSDFLTAVETYQA